MASLPQDHASLLDSCREGDEAAWEEIVKMYGRLVYSIALRRFRLSEADASDVYQETFAALLKNLDTIETPDALRSWIASTATNLCLHLLRDHKHRGRLHRRYSRERDGSASFEPLREEQEAGRLGRIERVRRLWEEMEEPCRTILHDRYMVEPPRPYEEIAERTDLAVGSVGPTRARCLQRLLKALRSLETEE